MWQILHWESKGGREGRVSTPLSSPIPFTPIPFISSLFTIFRFGLQYLQFINILFHSHHSFSVQNIFLSYPLFELSTVVFPLYTHFISYQFLWYHFLFHLLIPFITFYFCTIHAIYFSTNPLSKTKLLRIQTELCTAGADATVYVWFEGFLCQTYKWPEARLNRCIHRNRSRLGFCAEFQISLYFIETKIFNFFSQVTRSQTFRCIHRNRNRLGFCAKFQISLYFVETKIFNFFVTILNTLYNVYNVYSVH